MEKPQADQITTTELENSISEHSNIDSLLASIFEHHAGLQRDLDRLQAVSSDISGILSQICDRQEETVALLSGIQIAKKLTDLR